MRRCLAIALVLLSASSTLAAERVWTSTDGRSMRGEFVRELDGEVTFLVAGKLVTIGLDRLTEADQQKVRDLAAGKEVADESVPAANAGAADSRPTSAGAANAPASESTEKPKPEEGDAESSKPAGAPSLTKKPRTNPVRVWTDNQGRQSTAKFVRVFGSTVVLARGNNPITVDFFDLSAADQAYIRDLLTSRGEENLIPPEPLAENSAGGQDEGNPGQPAPDSGPAVDPGEDSGPRVGPGAGRGPRGRGRGPGSGRIGGPGMGPGAGSAPAGAGANPRPPGAGFGPGFGPGGGFGPGSGMGPAGIGGPQGIGPGPQLGGSGTGIGTGPAIAPVTGPDSSGIGSRPDPSSIRDFAQEQREESRRRMEEQQRQDELAARSSAPPIQGYHRVPMCSNCRNQVSEEAAKGTSCPHCGARWQFNQYSSSSTTTTSGKTGAGLMPMSAAEAEKTVRSVILIVAVLGVAVVLVGGIIVAALAIASASRPRKQPQYRPYNN